MTSLGNNRLRFVTFRPIYRTDLNRRHQMRSERITESGREKSRSFRPPGGLRKPEKSGESKDHKKGEEKTVKPRE